MVALAAYALTAGVVVDTARFQGFTDEGTAGVIVGGVAWYLVYSRMRTGREGVLGVILAGRRDEEPVTPD